MSDESLFAEALAIPDPAARAAYLDQACAGRPDVRREVEELLAAHAAASPLDRPPAHRAPSGGPEHRPGAPQAAEGDLVGPYRLRERIGEGGMGEVWVADQTEPIRRRVALKLIKPGMDSRAVLARFEQERQALALMDHPNIAKVLDAGATADGRPYFVMELVKGVPITEFCDARRLTPRQRLELFVPVCQAIQHAHQKGIIHRDIKPSNVLVALHDDVPVPKVIDFGVAKAAGTPLTERSIYTGYGVLVGTPAYMAPEQAAFNQLDVDTRADVYALGVLLYELLAGSPPVQPGRLQRAALDEMLRIVREEEPPRPSQRLSTADTLPALAACRGTEPARLPALVRGELDWIAMKALDKDRNRRYETAAGFAADVQRYLAGEPVQAVPPSAGYRARKFLRKHRGPAAAAALVVLALVVGVLGATAGLVRAQAARAAEARARLQAEQERDQKERARQEADEHRIQAEHQAANAGIELDMQGQLDPKIELLRLARRLPSIPEQAAGLRDFVVRRMLLLGQEIRPLVRLYGLLSPDGRLLIHHDGSRVRVLEELDTGRELAVWRGEGQFVVRAGQTLVLKEIGDRLHLCDASGNEVMVSQPLPPGTRKVLASADGKRWLIVTHDPHSRYGDSGVAGVSLWDGESGRPIAELPEHRGKTWEASFSPDGTVLVTAVDGWIRAWSAEGRLVRELGRFPRVMPRPSFSPGGQWVAALERQRLHRWRVGAWEDEGLSLPMPTYDEEPRWLDRETVGVGLESGHTLIPGVGTVPASVEQLRGDVALVRGGVLLDVPTERRLPVPKDRRFPAEAKRFAVDGRFLRAEDRLYDLRTDKVVLDRLIRLDDGHQRYLVCELRDRPMGEGSVVRLVPRGEVPAASLMGTWAGLAARGELNATGEFVAWDEKTWEERRQETLQAASGPAASQLARVLRDPTWWLRGEIDEARHVLWEARNERHLRGKDESRGPGHPTAAEASVRFLALYDRLVAAAPTWSNYAERAEMRATLGEAPWWASFRYEQDPVAPAGREHYLALLDSLEASRRAGVWIPHGYSTSWAVAVTPGLPREYYETALRWELARRAAGAGSEPVTIAMFLYRLGRAAEAQAELGQVAAANIPVQAGEIVLAGAAATGVPTPGLAALTCAARSAAAVQTARLLPLRSLCLHQLGQTDLARKYLAASRPDSPLYREAVERVGGQPAGTPP